MKCLLSFIIKRNRTVNLIISTINNNNQLINNNNNNNNNLFSYSLSPPSLDMYRAYMNIRKVNNKDGNYLLNNNKLNGNNNNNTKLLNNNNQLLDNNNNLIPNNIYHNIISSSQSITLQPFDEDFSRKWKDIWEENDDNNNINIISNVNNINNNNNNYPPTFKSSTTSFLPLFLWPFKRAFLP